MLCARSVGSQCPAPSRLTKTPDPVATCSTPLRSTARVVVWRSGRPALTSDHCSPESMLFQTPSELVAAYRVPELVGSNAKTPGGTVISVHVAPPSELFRLVPTIDPTLGNMGIGTTE